MEGVAIVGMVCFAGYIVNQRQERLAIGASGENENPVVAKHVARVVPVGPPASATSARPRYNARIRTTPAVDTMQHGRIALNRVEQAAVPAARVNTRDDIKGSLNALPLITREPVIARTLVADTAQSTERCQVFPMTAEAIRKVEQDARGRQARADAEHNSKFPVISLQRETRPLGNPDGGGLVYTPPTLHRYKADPVKRAPRVRSHVPAVEKSPTPTQPFLVHSAKAKSPVRRADVLRNVLRDFSVRGADDKQVYGERNVRQGYDRTRKATNSLALKGHYNDTIVLPQRYPRVDTQADKLTATRTSDAVPPRVDPQFLFPRTIAPDTCHTITGKRHAPLTRGDMPAERKTQNANGFPSVRQVYGHCESSGKTVTRDDRDHGVHYPSSSPMVSTGLQAVPIDRTVVNRREANLDMTQLNGNSAARACALTSRSGNPRRLERAHDVRSMSLMDECAVGRVVGDVDKTVRNTAGTVRSGIYRPTHIQQASGRDSAVYMCRNAR